MKKKHVKI